MKQKKLLLTLKKKPFEVMKTGEKDKEYRVPSQWLRSRLFDKNGNRRDYDVIEFVNGYGAACPRFTAIFNGFSNADNNHEIKYSNGLVVKVLKGDFIIYLGEFYKKYKQ